MFFKKINLLKEKIYQELPNLNEQEAKNVIATLTKKRSGITFSAIVVLIIGIILLFSFASSLNFHNDNTAMTISSLLTLLAFFAFGVSIVLRIIAIIKLTHIIDMVKQR